MCLMAIFLEVSISLSLRVMARSRKAWSININLHVFSIVGHSECECRITHLSMVQYNSHFGPDTSSRFRQVAGMSAVRACT